MGSSMAVRTREGGSNWLLFGSLCLSGDKGEEEGGVDSEGSRSDARNLRSMWVTWPVATRWATSGFRPSRGQMTVTRASALRQLRMRPAATCLYILFVSDRPKL